MPSWLVSASWREELGWHLLDWLLEHCPVQRGEAGMLWAVAVTPCDKRKPHFCAEKAHAAFSSCVAMICMAFQGGV